MGDDEESHMTVTELAAYTKYSYTVLTASSCYYNFCLVFDAHTYCYETLIIQQKKDHLDHGMSHHHWLPLANHSPGPAVTR